ncbi:16739_t:CDS:1, partial [Cetraspora pellucida]
MIALTRRILIKILLSLLLFVIIIRSAPIAVFFNDPSQTLALRNFNKRFIPPLSPGYGRLIGLGLKKVPVGTTSDESSSEVSQSFGQATEISDDSVDGNMVHGNGLG